MRGPVAVGLLIPLLICCGAQAQQPVLRMGYEHSPPVQLVGADQAIRGPIYEVLSRTAARKGVKLEWVHCPDGPDASLTSGKADLWPLIADLPQRRDYLFITSPYLRVRWWLITHEKSGITTLADTAGKRVLSLPGKLAEVLAAKYIPRARLEILPDINQALDQLCRGDGDGALVAQGTGDHLLLTERTCNVGRLNVLALPGAQLDFGIGARRNDRRAKQAAKRLLDGLMEEFESGGVATVWLRWGLVSPDSRLLADYLSAQRYNRLLSVLALLLLAALAVAVWQTSRWRRAQKAAQSAAEAKQAFLANMSHEIRTPMNGVLGLASLLEESPLSDDQREYVRTIRQSSQALLRLLNDVLDVAKIEAGQLRLVEAPFSLREILAEVSHLLEPQARAKGLGWRLEWDQALPTHWEGDGGRVRQVILNLAGNAVKFTSSGGVTLRACSAASGFRIEVVDTGPGIPAELREKIFEKFVQGAAPKTPVQAGTGLGLTISRSLAERMGGWLRVESEVGVGSTFILELPLKTASRSVSGQLDVAKRDLRSRQARTLVVEDNPVNQYVARRLLQRLGCEVAIAADGEKALAELERQHYDLIFMDCGLPGMSGYEVTRKLREREDGRRRTPVVALTAAALEGDRDRCLAAGMDDYLTKPLELAALAQALERWLPGDDATTPAGERVAVGEDRAGSDT